MKHSKVLKSILLLSGLIAAGIGGAILFLPESFHALNGIDLGGQVSLLSEVRAPGGALLVCGLLIISGAFFAGLTFTSALLSALLYLSYGVARIVSMSVDGIPATGLVQATMLELTIGLVCLFALLKYREPRRRSA